MLSLNTTDAMKLDKLVSQTLYDLLWKEIVCTLFKYLMLAKMSAQIL